MSSKKEYSANIAYALLDGYFTYRHSQEQEAMPRNPEIEEYIQYVLWQLRKYPDTIRILDKAGLVLDWNRGNLGLNKSQRSK